MTNEDQEKYNLPPGMPSPYYHPNRPNPPPQNFYVLSIMHQMHCLVCLTCARAGLLGIYVMMEWLTWLLIRIILGHITGKSRPVGPVHQIIRKRSGMCTLITVSNIFGKALYADMPLLNLKATRRYLYPAKEWRLQSLVGGSNMNAWIMTPSALTRLLENMNTILRGSRLDIGIG